MNAISQRLAGIIGFLPLDKFAIGFVLYMLAGTTMFVMQGTGIFPAFLLTFAVGIVLTAMVGAARPMWRFEREGFNDKPLAWRLLFGPLPFRSGESGGDGNSDPPKPDMKPDDELPSGIEDEEFKRRMRAGQIDSAKRAARRMHDKLIHTGLVVAIFMVAYWFAVGTIADFAAALFGTGGERPSMMFGPQAEIAFESPKDLFLFDWKVIVGIWIALIILLPKWMIYFILIAMSGMRVVFLVFGPMASMMIMQIGMLPFFYGFMMFFLFGSIIYPFIRQAKFYRPGDATWGTPRGAMRGQPEVRATVDVELAKLKDYIDGKSKRRPTRGMVFEGPPGTGKTLYAREIATEFNLPFVMIDGGALSGAPMGNLIVEYYLKPRTHSFAAEYGGVVFFIDEGEVLLGMRPGMGGGQTGGMGTELPSPNHEGIRDVWDLLPYDSIGATSSCGVLYDSSHARERFWQVKSHNSLGKSPKTYTHPFFFPMGGAGGGQMIFPFLTWLDGVGSPPAMETMKRRIFNNILDGLFFPTHIPGTQIILRLPPAKPINYTVLFIVATNRAFMLDPAIRRPGRLGVSARFITPNVESRRDIIDLYFSKADRDGLLRSELFAEEAIDEFARATSGMSPAEIEAAINSASDVRGTHVNNMKRIKALLDKGVAFGKLREQDQKYWLRSEEERKIDAWDDDRADMRSLLEARNTLIYGRADPGLTTDEHREQTALHEYWGHFIILKAALGDVMRPSILSVMPRGNALGMVAHIAVEERDPKPKRFYEGLLRVSIGSTVAERFFFGENQPGVAGDLENATRIACFMAGKVGMPPYKCSAQDKKKFAEIGETLIAVPEGSIAALNPFAQGFVEKVLSDTHSRERVAVMLGQAFVDDYRFIRANVVKDYEFHKGVIDELLRLDELGGAKLEEVWKELDERLVDWEGLTDEQRSWWPDNIAEIENYFYDPSKKHEAEEVLAQ
jgi:hypothetical protein